MGRQRSDRMRARNSSRGGSRTRIPLRVYAAEDVFLTRFPRDELRKEKSELRELGKRLFAGGRSEIERAQSADTEIWRVHEAAFNLLLELGDLEIARRATIPELAEDLRGRASEISARLEASGELRLAAAMARRFLQSAVLNRVEEAERVGDIDVREDRMRMVLGISASKSGGL